MTIWHLHQAAGSRPDVFAAATKDQLFELDALSASGTETTRLGSVRLRHHIGMELPRYWYHLGEVVHAAPALNLFRREQVLLLGNDFTAASELAEIRVEAEDCSPPEYHAIMKVLIRGGLLLLAQTLAGISEHLEGESPVIVELPGIREQGVGSPFWNGLGRFFHDADPEIDERLHGAAWRSHVAALLPRHPLVVSLLQPAARSAIGQICESASRLRNVLVEEGFGPSRHVGIIDAGPVYCADLGHQPEARSFVLGSIESDANADTGEFWLIVPQSEQEIWTLPAQKNDGLLLLGPEALVRCGLSTGIRVSALPLGGMLKEQMRLLSKK